MERRLVTLEILLERQKRKGFLHHLVTGDEKWIYYDNPKRQKSCRLPPKKNIHASKMMLRIWWDQKGVISYEHFKPSETICADRYRLQLMNLNQALKKMVGMRRWIR